MMENIKTIMEYNQANTIQSSNPQECIFCKHSIKHVYDEYYVCTKDTDLRRFKHADGRPPWCPLIERDPLDFVKSC